MKTIAGFPHVSGRSQLKVGFLSGSSCSLVSLCGTPHVQSGLQVTWLDSNWGEVQVYTWTGSESSAACCLYKFHSAFFYGINFTSHVLHPDLNKEQGCMGLMDDGRGAVWHLLVTPSLCCITADLNQQLALLAAACCSAVCSD